MTITKSKLADSVYHSTNLSKTAAIGAIESILEIIKSTLEGEEPILISGFGKFEVKTKNPRKGRNPQTGSDFGREEGDNLQILIISS